MTTQASLHGEVRTAALFFIEIMNRTKATEYYSRYSHTLIQCVEVMFRRQNSSLNEMIQHGITISGLCDITMPFKIDIMLTASNFARAEAGITRYQNPENFLLYRDSHGERKEKATSSDNPHLQRTLLRYTSDKNIVEVMDKHADSIDDVLHWDQDEFTRKCYFCASYKMIDKIDIEDVVGKNVVGKSLRQKGLEHRITKVHFDIIADGYGHDTIVNNIVLQLLILNGYLTVDEISRGGITEKINRETIAAAKYASVKKLKELQSA
jgi:hypothetical protein